MTDTPEFTLTNLTQPSGPAPGARRKRTGLIVGLIAAATAVIAAGGVGAYVLLGQGMTVNGIMVLTDQSGGIQVDSTNGSACVGKGGFQDMQAGTSVNITDAGNATIGLGALNGGEYDTTKGCVFSWKISDVPAGKKYYGVEVGHRGVVKFTESEMRHLVTLSLS